MRHKSHCDWHDEILDTAILSHTTENCQGNDRSPNLTFSAVFLTWGP